MADEKDNIFAGFETHSNEASTSSSNEGGEDSSQSTDEGSDEGKTPKEEADDFDSHEEGEGGDNGSNDDDDDTGSDEGDDGDDDSDDAGEDDDDTGDVGDTGDEDEEGDEDDDDQAELNLDDKPKPKKSVKERIGELTKKRRTAERAQATAEARAVAAEARAEAAEKKLTPEEDNDTGEDDTPPDGPKRPDPDDFDYGEVDPAYAEALADWRIDVRLNKDSKAATDAEHAKAVEVKTAELTAQFDDAVELGVAAYDDFEAVVIERADKSEYPVSAEIVVLTLDSPVGHHVIYEIASTPGLPEKLAQMSPAQQGKEFGRLEAQYQSENDDKTPPKKKHTKAKQPPPKKRAGGAAPKQIDAGTSNFSDFEKKVAADQRGKQRK